MTALARPCRFLLVRRTAAYVKGFRMPAGRRREGCTEAGVRKASKEESAGSFAPAVVSVYGDLTRGCETLAGFRMGTPGA